MGENSDVKTTLAFNIFRKAFCPPKELPKELVANQDQVRQMSTTDGMKCWQDGSIDPLAASADEAPNITAEHEAGKELWVIRQTDVPYASEACDFGRALESHVIKHSNLTGGEPAYSGGEMVILDDKTIVINGKSGRYGPRSENELMAVAKAFHGSGYIVWCMGFDHDTARPLPFVGSKPIRIT